MRSTKMADSNPNRFEQNAALWVHGSETKRLADILITQPIINSIVELAPMRRTRVLDIGCGDGYLLREAHRRDPSIECTGIDPADKLLAYAEQQSVGKFGETQKMKFVSTKLEDWESTDTFEFVTAIHVAHYAESLNVFFQKMGEHMRKTSTFHIGLLNPITYMESKKHGVIPGKKNPHFHFPLTEDYDYYNSEGKWIEGTVSRLDGTELPVGFFHHTLETYISALDRAGLCVHGISPRVISPAITAKYPHLKSVEGWSPYTVIYGGVQ